MLMPSVEGHGDHILDRTPTEIFRSSDNPDPSIRKVISYAVIPRGLEIIHHFTFRIEEDSPQAMPHSALYWMSMCRTNTLLFAIEVHEEIPPEPLRTIIKPQLPINPIYLLDLIICQRQFIVKIPLNPRFGLTLGDDRATMCDTPCQRDLSTCLTMSLADFNEDGVVNQLAIDIIILGILVAEWAILGNMDTVRLVEGNEVLPLKPRMHFHLVDGRNLGVKSQSFQSLECYLKISSHGCNI